MAFSGTQHLQLHTELTLDALLMDTLHLHNNKVRNSVLIQSHRHARTYEKSTADFFAKEEDVALEEDVSSSTLNFKLYLTNFKFIQD